MVEELHFLCVWKKSCVCYKVFDFTDYSDYFIVLGGEREKVGWSFYYCFFVIMQHDLLSLRKLYTLSVFKDLVFCNVFSLEE